MQGLYAALGNGSRALGSGGAAVAHRRRRRVVDAGPRRGVDVGNRPVLPMDLQDATLDDVEAVVVAKLLEGVGFVSVHLERHALIVAPTFRSRSHRAACLLGGGASAQQRRQPARDTGASTAVRTARLEILPATRQYSTATNEPSAEPGQAPLPSFGRLTEIIRDESELNDVIEMRCSGLE